MTKHTPGPWITNGGQIETEQGVYNGGIIATVGIVNHQDATDIANARLIAAAPELLAAAKQAREHLVYYRSVPAGQTVMDNLDAAIAKAEGR